MILLDLELSPNLIYQLVNSNISDENSKKLLEEIIEDVDVKKISFDKTEAISYIIDNGLSEKNINYICKNFRGNEEHFDDKSNYYDNSDVINRDDIFGENDNHQNNSDDVVVIDEKDVDTYDPYNTNNKY